LGDMETRAKRAPLAQLARLAKPVQPALQGRPALLAPLELWVQLELPAPPAHLEKPVKSDLRVQLV
jgi:hypothetical protein